jgi:hypothetical protein
MRSRRVQPIGPLARTCAPLRAWVAWSSIVLSETPACAAGATQTASDPASATLATRWQRTMFSTARSG